MLLKINQKLKIPFDRHFFNLPVSHYDSLCEEVGTPQVLRYVRELIVHHRGNQQLAEKARILYRKLDQKMLTEDKLDDPYECECGFDSMGESYEKCPICGKQIYTGKECYYKQDDSLCSLDAGECKWSGYAECGKMEQE